MEMVIRPCSGCINGYDCATQHLSQRHLGETGAFAPLSSLDIVLDLAHLSRHTLVALADKSSA